MRPKIAIVEVQEATAMSPRRVTLQVSYSNKTASLQIDPTDHRLSPADACRLEIHADLMNALEEWCRLGDEIGDLRG